MQTTIDSAGRLVVPKELRERLGITGGSRVELREEGSGIKVELVASDNVVEVGDYLLVAGGGQLTDDDVRELRLGNQR